MIGDGIAFGVNLVKSFLRAAVDFQFHHVEDIGHLHHDVCPSADGLYLRADIDVEHMEKAKIVKALIHKKGKQIKNFKFAACMVLIPSSTTIFAAHFTKLSHT